MLHLEIRQENGEYKAYKVDHNPDVPDVFLLSQNRAMQTASKTYSLQSTKLGKWIIIESDTTSGSGGGATDNSKRTLFSKDDNNLGIVIGLFNAAPGKELLEVFSSAASNGLTEPQLADRLAAHPIFTNNIIGGKSTAEQVTELMNHFGLVADGVQGSAASIAETLFTQSIESNVGYGSIATLATFYLLSNELLGTEVHEKFYLTSILFKLKIAAADDYSIINPSTDLATLQAVLAEIINVIGTDDPDNLEGGGSGGVLDPGGGGDIVNLEDGKEHRDVVNMEEGDSRLNDIDEDGSFTISDTFFKNGTLPSLDSINNFSVGTTNTDDRINLVSFNFKDTQAGGIVNVSSRVPINMDLRSFPDLFSDEDAGDRGVAFLEYFDDESRPTTYVFIDANKDGDFTAADDMFFELVDVKDLINENFIYFRGDIGGVSEPAINPTSTVFNLSAGNSVVEGNALTYTVTASEAVATDTVVEFTVVPSGTGADQGTADTNANDFLVGSLDTTSVTILAGQKTATFGITFPDDGITELHENFSVKAVVDGNTLSIDTTLRDRLEDLGFSLGQQSFRSEGDRKDFTFKATEAVAGDIDVVFTVVAGDATAADSGTSNTNLNDFVAGTFDPVTVTIPAGQTTAIFSVTPLDDGLTELSENYSVRADLDIGNSTATLTVPTILLDGQSGVTFALTESSDFIIGTSGDDVINGFVESSAGTTIKGGDIIDGADGIDTLNITGNVSVTNTNGALVSNIEIVNLRVLKATDTFTFDATSVAGVAEINGSLSLGALFVIDNADGGNVISTGAGNDEIFLTDKTSGTGTTVTGGAGADIIVTHMMGNAARDSMKFVYKAGDSVSDSSPTGISATLTDTIANLDGETLSATAGSSVEFDTEVQATAVTAGTTDVVLGTTTVSNAGDFFVNTENTSTTWIYQDTDGDKVIEAGEFALSLTGIQGGLLFPAYFTVSGGDLMLVTA